MAISLDTPPTLTTREMQCLRAMTRGLTNAGIGRELFISEDTVKTHLRRLFRKVGARDRAHAVAIGYCTGLLRVPAPGTPQDGPEQPYRDPTVERSWELDRQPGDCRR